MVVVELRGLNYFKQTKRKIPRRNTRKINWLNPEDLPRTDQNGMGGVAQVSFR